MNDSIIRYQYNPLLTDTAGFFDVCIPLTNEARPPKADSLQKYYDFSIYNYITPAPEPKQLLHSTSVFVPHNLKPVHQGPLAINRQSGDWATLVFIVCLLVVAWIQTFYPKRLIQIFRAVAQPHFLNQLEREGNLFKERIRLGLSFIYYCIASIFIFLLVNEFGGIPSGMSNFGFTAAVFAGLFIFESVKSLLVYFTGMVFGTTESARQYQLNTMIFNQITGITLLPVIITAFYWNNIYIIYTGIAIVSLLLLYRTFRGILTGMTNNNYNLFYLFLYLCTLEILPLFILFRVVSKG